MVFNGCSGLTSVFFPNSFTFEVINSAIPDTAARVKYTVTDGKVTITEITLGNGQTSVDIPETICGYPIVAVAEAYRDYVGNHTCAGGTAACTAKAVCGLCGKEYGDVDPANHTLTHHAPVSHTCTTDGNVEYWECSDCGKYFSDSNGTNVITNIVDPAKHSLVKTEAKAPTCTEDGKKAYWTCSVCGKIFSDEAGTSEVTDETSLIIPAPGHNCSANWEQDATHHWHKCSDCDEKVDFAAHTEDRGTVTVQPTATTTGVRVYSSSVCGYVLRTETIPATGYSNDPTSATTSTPSVFTEKLTANAEVGGRR